MVQDKGFHLKKPRKTLWWAGAVAILLVAALIMFLYVRSHRQDQPYSDSVNIGQLKKESAVAAVKLEASPPSTTASVEDKTDYYSQLISLLGTTGNSNAKIITSYETAVSQGISFPSEVLVVVARAYSNQGGENNKAKARAVLDTARKYVRDHGEDKDSSGLTTGQLEWIGDEQKEMGL